MTDTLIQKTVFLAAPPETVWRFLTEADKLGTWFHPADADMTEGADYMLRNGADGDPMCWGKVREMTPPTHMVWDFTVGPMDGMMTTVEWRLAPAPGGTRLTLSHAGLPAVKEAFGLVMALDKGWHDFLRNLHETATTDYSATIIVPAKPMAAKTAIFDQMDQWWSSKVAKTDSGARIEFGNSHVEFAFSEGDRKGDYVWACTDANMIIEDVADATEWQGTSLRWRITDIGEGSRITLTHQGLNADLECLDVCTRGWQHFFEDSLKAHLSGGEPSPETR